MEILEIKTPDTLLRGFEIIKELRGHLTLSSFQQLYEAAKTKGDYRLVGAYDNGECLAVMGYRILFDFVHGKHVYIDDLVVTSKKRSSGIGAELLRHAEKVAREAHCQGLRLCTGLESKDAQRFYERNGWNARAVAYKKLVNH